MQKEIMDVIHGKDIDAEAFFLALPKETQRHCENVAKLTGQLLQWAKEEAPAIYGALPPRPLVEQAARYHDIGLVLIPDRVLHKQEALTCAEFRVIQQHAAYGGSILERQRKAVTGEPAQTVLWSLAAEIALGHHERWDGKGYPFGQLATAVPAVVRAVAIADAFDSVVRGASYRMALPAEYALLEIVHNAGRQFDPDLSKIFSSHDEALLNSAVEPVSCQEASI